MNYQAYHSIDVINGPGTRVTLFVSGCEHQCLGCYNPKTWHAGKGEPYCAEFEEQLMADLASPFIPKQGLSLSGGDPLLPANLPTILALVKRVKTQLPEKDIWCWTGYCLEQLSAQQQKILPYIDVLVDGPFQQENKDARLVWRGSSNQRILQMSDSSVTLIT